MKLTGQVYPNSRTKPVLILLEYQPAQPLYNRPQTCRHRPRSGGTARSEWRYRVPAYRTRAAS